MANTRNPINIVWGGKYNNKKVYCGNIAEDYSLDETIIKFSPETVESYTVIDAMPSPSFSYGGAQLDWDMLYIIEIAWKDGEKSLIYLDRREYESLIYHMYVYSYKQDDEP